MTTTHAESGDGSEKEDQGMNNEEAQRQQIADMAADRRQNLDNRNKTGSGYSASPDRSIREEQQKLGFRPKPTPDGVLKSWCLVESSYASRMMPSDARGLLAKAGPDDVRNWNIAERVLSGRSRMQLMVFHVAERGFKPQTFRLFDDPIPPALPCELAEFKLNHDLIKTACWRNIKRMIQVEIDRSPREPMMIDVVDDEAPLPESARNIDLNPAKSA